MGFSDYLVRRLIYTIFIIIGITILIFVLTRVLPGDPVRLALGPEASGAQIEQTRRIWGLDQPLYIQYFRFVIGFFTLDWGMSTRTLQPVIDDIAKYGPASYELSILSLLIAVAIGLPLGIVSAVNKDKWQDHLGRITSLTGVAMPIFWTGLMLQLLLSSYLGIFPIGMRLSPGMDAPSHITGFYTIDSLLAGDWGLFWDASYHLILPALVLSFPGIANISRLMRSTMIDQRSKEYITLQTTYGMPRRLITYKYMLKNSFAATLTMIALMFAYSLGGIVLIERVFIWPGLGTYLVDGIWYKDFNAIMSVVVMVGIIIVIANLIADLIYGYLDPRIRYGADN